MTILIVIILALGAAIGCYQGAFKQIANLFGVVVGLVLAAVLYERCGDYLASKSGTSASVGQIAAFVIIVVVVPLVLGVLASMLTKLFSVVHLGCLNRMVGAVIGVVSYGLILSFAFNVYDFVEGKFGFSTESLEKREDSFYKVKHVCHPIIPDFLIVSDSTEVAQGYEAKKGVKGVVDEAVKDIFNK